MDGFQLYILCICNIIWIDPFQLEVDFIEMIIDNYSRVDCFDKSVFYILEYI